MKFFATIDYHKVFSNKLIIKCLRLVKNTNDYSIECVYSINITDTLIPVANFKLENIWYYLKVINPNGLSKDQRFLVYLESNTFHPDGNFIISTSLSNAVVKINGKKN